MSRIRYAPKVIREIVGFALENKVYWMIPLGLVLLAAAMLVGVSQGLAPLIYTLF